MKIAEQFEQVGQRNFPAGQQGTRLPSCIARCTNETLPVATVRQFIADWLLIKEPEVSPGHDRFYKKSTTKFLEFLGLFGNGREEFVIFHRESEFSLDSLCH
jgi:hypothetical protein